ncbi:putative flippase GtrA [Nocardioides albertanoniae]|uniref:Putative flippase GtrA n=1 Tax=Nocardioides albertanoniae TaxID=1175486 RepID=A0A543AC86_9ACTN|nr:GtrA family protein [Nocardioides albertanoniae]TQL70096.1 putative flippase GtrA [Nocardioides albertanoniae]
MAFGGQLLDRLRRTRLFGEVIRFMMVGGIATAVAFVMFNGLVHGFFLGAGPMNGQPIPAYIIANTVGMVISYDLSRRWTFRHRVSEHPDGGFTAYVVINAVTMLLPVACLYLTRNVIGWDSAIADNLSANVVGVLMGQVARFFLFRKFVFAKPIRYTQVYGSVEEQAAARESAADADSEGTVLVAPEPRARIIGSTDRATHDRAR